jgi:hypothetical protein
MPGKTTPMMTLGPRPRPTRVSRQKTAAVAFMAAVVNHECHERLHLQLSLKQLISNVECKEI